MDEKPKIQHFKPTDHLMVPGSPAVASEGDSKKQNKKDGSAETEAPPKFNLPFKLPGRKGFLTGATAFMALAINFQFIYGMLRRMGFIQKIEEIGLGLWEYATHEPIAFCFGILALFLIHEAGHMLVLMLYGLRFKPKYLIPVAGSGLARKDMEPDSVQTTYSAFGGPVLGGVAAYFCLSVYHSTGQSLFLALAQAGFVMNLIPLIPLRKFDGALITACFSKIIWALTLGYVIYYFISRPKMEFFMITILLIFILRFITKLFEDPQKDDPLKTLPLYNKGIIALGFICLVSFLYLMAIETYGIIQEHPLS
jgi:Zn-dependent protease